MTLATELISQTLVLCPFINCPMWCNLLPDFPLISPLLSWRISHLRQSDSFGAYCFLCCVSLLSSKPNLLNCQRSRIHFVLCALQGSRYPQLHQLLRWNRVFTMDESAFSPESRIPKRDELQPLYSQTPLIGRSFWPNVANFGNCLYLPYHLLGCTSRFSHFFWVGRNC